MRKLIKWFSDLQRLTEENEHLKAEIATLESRLRQELGKPAFEQVSKNFTLDGLHKRVYDRVIEDFAGFVSRDALELLKAAFHPNAYRSASGSADVAYNRDSQVFQMRFTLPSVHTEVVVHQDMVYGR